MNMPRYKRDWLDFRCGTRTSQIAVLQAAVLFLVGKPQRSTETIVPHYQSLRPLGSMHMFINWDFAIWKTGVSRVIIPVGRPVSRRPVGGECRITLVSAFGVWYVGAVLEVQLKHFEPGPSSFAVKGNRDGVGASGWYASISGSASLASILVNKAYCKRMLGKCGVYPRQSQSQQCVYTQDTCTVYASSAVQCHPRVKTQLGGPPCPNTGAPQYNHSLGGSNGNFLRVELS
jgi:hypothetical protein